MPLTQRVPVVQAFPQAPQFAVSDITFAQPPSPTPHSVCPAGQIVLHIPALHDCAPTHAVVQLPQ
jgi:hypothetical protein